MDPLPLSRSALAYANSKHQRQHRADGSRFILHPLEVAGLLHDSGAPDHLIAAGLLHDVLEKTSATAADLRARFGPRVSSLVVAVSENDRISGYAARKAALRRQVANAGDEAAALFAADKISKLRELRREAIGEDQTDQTTSSVPRADRLRQYQGSLALLEERLPNSPLVHELRAELRDSLHDRRVRPGAGHTV
jgi:(p)ppGpp synthase/HD superfamily hydrolase